VDTFTRDHLPPFDQWPDLLLDRPEFQYPEYLNAAVELTDRMVAKGFGDHVALIGNGRQRTYKELTDWTNRLAHSLVEDFGVKPGNRVLIRSGNNPAMVAVWLAVTKAGAVAVNTMPLLRAGELTAIINKAEIGLALCDTRIADELVAAGRAARFFAASSASTAPPITIAELDRVALNKPVTFDAVRTGRDDVALLGFTSGTTGEPKATVHFHRDLLIIADGYAKEVLRLTPQDVFVGSPPLAFTFGLGGLAIFPLRFGATATLLENASPANMIGIIETYKATISFTSPTAYRAMMAAMDDGADLSSLRMAISAGETLPAPVFEDWTRKTGKPILDGIGTTELLHIFISNRLEDSASGATGRPVTGYEARIVDEHEGSAGRHGRPPGGARTDRLPYLADDRQTTYVRDGFNLTGDDFFRDSNGVFHFVARADDMIISSGYNIAGPRSRRPSCRTRMSRSAPSSARPIPIAARSCRPISS
jgi:Acyl-coenzyme A synthetases/AMP-(fatty) acid ligases